jgi:hypothetical protein
MEKDDSISFIQFSVGRHGLSGLRSIIDKNYFQIPFEDPSPSVEPSCGIQHASSAFPTRISPSTRERDEASHFEGWLAHPRIGQHEVEQKKNQE